MFGKTSSTVGIVVIVVLLVLAVAIWRLTSPPQIKKPPMLPPLGSPAGAPGHTAR